jgi:magnesium transporter
LEKKNSIVTASQDLPAEQLHDFIESGTLYKIKGLIKALPAADVAQLLSSSPPEERRVLWEFFDETLQGEIIKYFDPEILTDLLSDKTAEEIAHVIGKVNADDDLTDIIQGLPDRLTSQVLSVLDSWDRERVENLLVYDEDTAGGLMDTQVISVRPRVTIDVVLRYLRRHDYLPETTDKIFVVDNQGRYIGFLPLSTVLVSDPATSVAECMKTSLKGIPADMSETDVARLFERYDLISAAVINDRDLLVGRITIDDIVDVIIDEADHSILGMAGLNEDSDPFAPIMKTTRSRALWLGANLITAFIASAVINIFEDTLEKVIALAILMPIVASMGGVAGSQTLTLVIRNMALGTLNASNMAWLLRRELAVGGLNGIFLSIVVAAVTAMIFNDPILGAIIAFALVINLVIAALSGVLLPGILKALGIDPAIAGTVVLTTITDVVGLLSFLSLATYFYA